MPIVLTCLLNLCIFSQCTFSLYAFCYLPLIQQNGTRPFPILHFHWKVLSTRITAKPRFVFTRCCSDAGHYINANNVDFSKNLLQGSMKLRNDLIKILVQNSLTGFKVLDCCCVTDCSPTAVISEQLDELRKTTARDGIHFTVDGYRNLAARTNSCLQSLMENSVQLPKRMNHFWHGFRSAQGSSVQRARATSLRSATGAPRGAFQGYSRGSNPIVRGRHFHPYKRW
jgi:hypothetical protein